MKVSEEQLHLVEKELHRMAELSRALASDASFLVFTLLMACGEGGGAPGELSLSIPPSSIDALRAVCRTVTGLDGDDLDDAALVQELADAAVRLPSTERAARALTRALTRAAGRRGAS